MRGWEVNIGTRAFTVGTPNNLPEPYVHEQRVLVRRSRRAAERERRRLEEVLRPDPRCMTHGGVVNVTVRKLRP